MSLRSKNELVQSKKLFLLGLDSVSLFPYGELYLTLQSGTLIVYSEYVKSTVQAAYALKNSISRQQSFGLSIKRKVFRILADALGVETSHLRILRAMQSQKFIYANLLYQLFRFTANIQSIAYTSNPRT